MGGIGRSMRLCDWDVDDCFRCEVLHGVIEFCFCRPAGGHASGRVRWDTLDRRPGRTNPVAFHELGKTDACADPHHDSEVAAKREPWLSSSQPGGSTIQPDFSFR